jgi:integrase
MGVRLEHYRDRHGIVQERYRVDFIFEHPSGRMERVRKVSPVNTKRGAERYEHELCEAMLSGLRNTARDIPTLANFSKDFVQTYAKAENKPSEVAKKEQILRKHLLPVLGTLRLDELTRKDVAKYKSVKLAEGYKAKTINNHLAVLSKLLDVAQEWGAIETAPGIRPLKAATPEFRWLTPEEAARLTGAANDQWRVMVFTGLRAGLRLGELRALRWQDVDLDGGQIVVRQAAWENEVGTPKGGRAREVMLGEEIRAALAKHPRRLRCELVFPGQDGGLLDTSGCVWALRRIGTAAGLGHVGWHVLRHTFASHLVQRGVKIMVVRDLLGHADIRTTMRYAHLAPDAGRSEVRLLDGHLMANQKVVVSN